MTWTPQTVGGSSGGFDSKTAGTPVDLSMNIKTPKPGEIVKNSEGQPLIYDYILYIPGVYAFGIDDHIEFDNTYAFGDGISLIRKKDYKVFGNYTMIYIETIYERADV